MVPSGGTGRKPSPSDTGRKKLKTDESYKNKKYTDPSSASGSPSEREIETSLGGRVSFSLKNYFFRGLILYNFVLIFVILYFIYTLDIFVEFFIILCGIIGETLVMIFRKRWFID